MQRTFRYIATALLAFALGGAAAQSPSPLVAHPPGITLQRPASYSFLVGDLRIIALSDGTVPQDVHALLLNTSPAHSDALLHDVFLTNPVEASINAFLFQRDGHTVLVDTGAGDLFGPLAGKLAASLATTGITPAQVTDVLLTHAHDDHMGGLVHNGQLVFPNALVHVGQPDIDFFLNRSNAAKAHYDISYFNQFDQTLRVALDAGKVKTFSGTSEVLPGVVATVHPGHTPGSAFYTVSSAGASITFTGDLFHVPAIQAPEPAISIVYDVDPVEAASLREQSFARFAREGTLIAVPHMPFPGVGHIRSLGSGYEWLPVVFGNRDPSLPTTFEKRHSSTQ